jgi:8-oxo-dGTP diphosphatase
MSWRVGQYKVSRMLGRFVTQLCAALTLGRMPPFVSTSAVVIRDGDILIVVDPILREPVLPGGHLKWRETPVRALVREVQEETGYTIVPESLLDVYASEELGGEPGVVRIVYAASVRGGNLRSSPEGIAGWLPAAEVTSTRDGAIIQQALESLSQA